MSCPRAGICNLLSQKISKYHWISHYRPVRGSEPGSRVQHVHCGLQGPGQVSTSDDLVTLSILTPHIMLQVRPQSGALLRVQGPELPRQARDQSHLPLRGQYIVWCQHQGTRDTVTWWQINWLHGALWHLMPRGGWQMTTDVTTIRCTELHCTALSTNHCSVLHVLQCPAYS